MPFIAWAFCCSVGYVFGFQILMFGLVHGLPSVGAELEATYYLLAIPITLGCQVVQRAGLSRFNKGLRLLNYYEDFVGLPATARAKGFKVESCS